MFHRRPWGSGASNGTVYRYAADRDNHRMGRCAWLPEDGDLCVCTGHSGDFFRDYVALRKTADGTWQRAGKFGAYFFGEAVAKLPEREFHLAAAGEPIDIRPHLIETASQ